MTKYEYKIVSVTWASRNQDEMQRILDDMGQDGWSLGTQLRPSNDEGLYLYFQRPVPVTYDYIVETQPYWGQDRMDQHDRYITSMGNLGWTLLHKETTHVEASHTTFHFVWSKPKN